MYTRTWQCPDCDYSVVVSYEQLAECGSPICSSCDSEMELLPVKSVATPLKEENNSLKEENNSSKNWTFTLDGVTYSYKEDTPFYVQVGRWRGAYITKWRFTGNFNRAYVHYWGLNVGNGYKKRLVMGDKKLLVERS